MNKLILILLFLTTTLFSCTKDNPCANSVPASLQNLTGLDGCGWVLVLEDGSKLEPTNLDEFPINLSQGKKVNVAYHTLEMASICMVGKIVEIDCLSER